ncbi:uncharacterized protein BDR25DRAFT_363059 [Lindgomyces ingoldianus]|uniref:Uncharacterized protein n=1 Tax=Lindgomyces ingoldianus TaxID=673940 RepID=A0ACB6Q8E5_9PLEO|nr:uncharacterized protein BDR25DRAFT_363059 [Lindgomyces ingoldianus]KAF2463151.1 hypothetical protein BDR25DRAFT_363059 [Lindgomyces ingoldianus]
MKQIKAIVSNTLQNREAEYVYATGLNSTGHIAFQLVTSLLDWTEQKSTAEQISGKATQHFTFTLYSILRLYNIKQFLFALINSQTTMSVRTFTNTYSQVFHHKALKNTPMGGLQPSDKLVSTQPYLTQALGLPSIVPSLETGLAISGQSFSRIKSSTLLSITTMQSRTNLLGNAGQWRTMMEAGSRAIFLCHLCEGSLSRERSGDKLALLEMKHLVSLTLTTQSSSILWHTHIQLLCFAMLASGGFFSSDFAS